MPIDLGENINIIEGFDLTSLVSIYNELLDKYVANRGIPATKEFLYSVESTIEYLTEIIFKYEIGDDLPNLHELDYTFIHRDGIHSGKNKRTFGWVHYKNDGSIDEDDLEDAIRLLKHDLVSAYAGRSVLNLILLLIERDVSYKDGSVDALIDRLDIPDFMLDYHTFNGMYDRGYYEPIKEDILRAIEEATSNEEIKGRIQRRYEADIDLYKSTEIDKQRRRKELTDRLYENYKMFNRLQIVSTRRNQGAYNPDFYIKDSYARLAGIAVNEIVNILVNHLEEDLSNLPLTFIFREEVLAIKELLGIDDTFNERVEHGIIEVDSRISISRIDPESKVVSRGWSN